MNLVSLIYLCSFIVFTNNILLEFITIQALAFAESDRGTLLCAAAEVYITVLGVLPTPTSAAAGVCNQLRRLSFYKNAERDEMPTSVCPAGRGRPEDFVVARRGGRVDMFAAQELRNGPVQCVQLRGTFAETVSVESDTGSWQIVARGKNGAVYLITDKCTLSS